MVPYLGGLDFTNNLRVCEFVLYDVLCFNFEVELILQAEYASGGEKEIMKGYLILKVIQGLFCKDENR